MPDSQRSEVAAFREAHNLPTLYIGSNDLSVLRNVIQGYLVYSRRTTKPTPESMEQARLLEGIYQRLIAKSGS